MNILILAPRARFEAYMPQLPYIMNFLYLGRKEELMQLTKDSYSYIVMNFMR